MTTDAARNLLSYRSTRSVWDRRGWQGATLEERVLPWIASMTGAGLLTYGASRRSWLGAFYMGVGATLIACAMTRRRIPSVGVVLRSRWRSAADDDQVTVEMMDSFPASDAPASNATTVAGGRWEGRVAEWDAIDGAQQIG